MNGYRRLHIVLLLLPVLIVIGLMMWARLASRPSNLGVTSGSLSPCPDSPNCVCSSDPSPLHAIEPFPLHGRPSDSLRQMQKLISANPRATLVEVTDEYLRAEFRSKLFGFVDDVEFYASSEATKMSCRSASRIGHSDLGANRKRIEMLRQAYDASPRE